MRSDSGSIYPDPFAIFQGHKEYKILLIDSPFENKALSLCCPLAERYHRCAYSRWQRLLSDDEIYLHSTRHNDEQPDPLPEDNNNPLQDPEGRILNGLQKKESSDLPFHHPM